MKKILQKTFMQRHWKQPKKSVSPYLSQAMWPSSIPSKYWWHQWGILSPLHLRPLCGLFNPVSENLLLRDEHASIFVILAASSPVGESWASRLQRSGPNHTPVYNFDNFEQDAISWYDMTKKKIFLGLNSENQEELEFVDLVKNMELSPAIPQAMITLLTLPATTSTVERSFSTMRWVKTWLRSTMSDERLSGLCPQKPNKLWQKFIHPESIDKFGRDPRRLHFFFKNWLIDESFVFLAKLHSCKISLIQTQEKFFCSKMWESSEWKISETKDAMIFPETVNYPSLDLW